MLISTAWAQSGGAGGGARIPGGAVPLGLRCGPLCLRRARSRRFGRPKAYGSSARPNPFILLCPKDSTIGDCTIRGLAGDVKKCNEM